MRRLPVPLVLVSLVLLALVASPAAAFPGEDDDTPGERALSFDKRPNTWATLDFGALDGKVVTSPPDSAKYDRRLESFVDFGFDAAFTSRIALRVDAKGSYVMRRQQEQEAPQTTVDERQIVYDPSADLTFTTDKGLEIFGGAENQIDPAYDQVTDSSNGTSNTHFHQASVIANRFGIVRRAGQWSGGFYYVMGASSSREVDETAFDGTSNQTGDVVFIPSRVGVMGNFKAGAAVWDFELDFIQARGMGPKDAQGNTEYADYFALRFGANWALGSGVGLYTGLGHETESYATSSFVTLDTIPVTTAKLLLTFGDDKSHAEFGIVGANGKDGQSLPEFNAHYQYNAAALRLGYVISL